MSKVNSFGQFPVTGLSSNTGLSIEFVKHSLEVPAGNSFFNIVKVVNKSEKAQSVNLSFIIPPNWVLFNEENNVITIKANDSLLIPLRGAASKEVLGEIGYSIIAGISDRKGIPIQNAYCFIKIPKVKRLLFTPITRTSYFDQETKKAVIQFKISNKGNVEELVTLALKTDKYTYIDGEKENVFLSEVFISPETDTVFSYVVTLISGEEGKTNFFVDLQIVTEDKTMSSSFWIEKLDNKYKNLISVSDKPLVIELGAKNIFSNRNPYYLVSLKGNTLLKQHRTIFYSYRKSNFGKSNNPFDEFSRINIGYKSPNLHIQYGDYLDFPLYMQNSRGGYFSGRVYNKLSISGIYSDDNRYSIRNYGFSMKNTEIKRYYEAYYFNTSNEFNNLKSNTFMVNSNIYLIDKKHPFKTSLGFSNIKFNYSNVTKQGILFKTSYRTQINKLSFDIQGLYGSPYYYGKDDGNMYVRSNIYYRINKNNNLQIYLNNYLNNPIRYYSDSVVENLYFKSGQYTMNYYKITSTGIRYNLGPSFYYSSANNYKDYDINSPFRIEGVKLNLGLRVGDALNSIYPQFHFGYSWVAEYDTSYSTKKNIPSPSLKPILNTELSANIRLKKFGALINYNLGPYLLSNYFNYFYYSTPFHTFRIIPYYERFIFKDIIKIYANASYINDIIVKTQRITSSIELFGYLNNDLTLSFLNTYNYQRSFIGPADEEELSKYSYAYFEFKIKKEFNWNQPRYKYYNLKIVFYKDLNGNLKKDYNEPGMKDILVTIKKEQVPEQNKGIQESDLGGHFNTTTLLSGFYGEVEYENIIEGIYQIEFLNVGQSKGRFSSGNNIMSVQMKKDETIYVPFLEHNKIFGKIILNRSKLSNLGKIDVSNVKVKAIDSQGNETSTLTDANGNFTIFAPSVDRYIVSINNIFYEHFDLQQNNYYVQLNGYKQFEVNFVFNEKRREINFTPSFSEEEIAIRTIKRTNITGTVRDESTLSPLLAKIEIVNNTTGQRVTEVHSDRTTGKFSMSFITSNNYSLIVSKEGYWQYTENLRLDQLTTIQDIRKDIILRDIIINSKFEIRSLRFTPGSTRIPNEAYPELDRLVSQFVNNPNIKVQIVGHSDALETLEDDKISEERAKEVTKYFIERGYSNIEYVGMKALQPAESNDTEAGRTQNRRVEIIIIDK